MSIDRELEMILYSTPESDVTVSAIIEEETLWLSQNAMAELFDSSKQTISYHLSNVFSEHELEKDAVVKEFLTTATDGKNYRTLHYNLDAIISVGYRVNSKKQPPSENGQPPF